MSTQEIPDFYEATDTFGTDLDVGGGQIEPVVVHAGEYGRAGHPLIQANPQYFRPVELSSRWDVVEQATAGPGERRNVGRAHKRVGRTGVPRDPRGISDEQ
jgi:hypothetical protein